MFSPLNRAFKDLSASEAIYEIEEWLGYHMSEVSEFWESYRDSGASQGRKLNIKPFRLKLVSKKVYTINTMFSLLHIIL